MNIDDIGKLPTEELVKTIDWLDLLATTNANYIFAHMVAVGELQERKNKEKSPKFIEDNDNEPKKIG